MAGYETVGSLGTASNPFIVSTSGGSTPGSVAVEGTVPAGQADSGNPVSVGGVVNTTPGSGSNVFANGQRAKLQLTADGAVRIAGGDINGVGVDGRGALIGISSPSGASGGATPIPLYTAGAVFNGTAWDRARGDVNGAYAVEKNRSVFYIETPSQTLAATAVFTGATRDVGVAPGALCPYPRFGVFVNASQAGTLTIMGSDDNFTTSYVVATQAIAAATPVDVTVPVRARYHRAQFTNGAAAQTSIVVKTGYQA